MTSSWQLEVKMNAKCSLDRKTNLREVTMKYDRLVVFIRHDLGLALISRNFLRNFGPFSRKKIFAKFSEI